MTTDGAIAIWLGILAAAYAAFWVWYGGRGRPLSAEQGEVLLGRMERLHGVNRHEAPDGSLIRNLAEMIPLDDGREFYAVNLETRREGSDAMEAEKAYTRSLLPILLSRAGHPVFVSERAGLMLGEFGRRIDRVAVVRYRSLRDLLEMVTDPAMPAAGEHKFAALEHTEVFITRPTVSIVKVRLLVALLLVIAGWAGVAAIGHGGDGGDRQPAASRVR